MHTPDPLQKCRPLEMWMLEGAPRAVAFARGKVDAVRLLRPKSWMHRFSNRKGEQIRG